MAIYTATVQDRTITMDKYDLVQNNVSIDQLVIVLDDEWDGNNRIKVVFYSASAQKEIEYVEGGIDFPWEITKNSEGFKMTFVGYFANGDRIVTREMKVFMNVNKSGLVEGEEAGDATKDAYQRIVEAAYAVEESANAAIEGANDAANAANTAAANANAAADEVMPELVDIRVGYDGKTYTTAGAAVRGQAEQLFGEIDYQGFGIDTEVSETFSAGYGTATAHLHIPKGTVVTVENTTENVTGSFFAVYSDGTQWNLSLDPTMKKHTFAAKKDIVRASMYATASTVSFHITANSPYANLVERIDTLAGAVSGGCEITCTSTTPSGVAYTNAIRQVCIPKGARFSIENLSSSRFNPVNVTYANGEESTISNNLAAGGIEVFTAEDEITRIAATIGTSGTCSWKLTVFSEIDEVSRKVDEFEENFDVQNMFNPNAEGCENGFIATNTGRITAYSGYTTSDFIPIEIGKTYSYPVEVGLYGTTAASRMPLFNSEKEFIGYVGGTITQGTANYLTATVPSVIMTGSVPTYGAAFTRFTYYNARANAAMFVNGSYPSDYIAFGDKRLSSEFVLTQKQKDEVIDLVGSGSVSPLYGKKIAYNGDSICESRLNTESTAYNGGAYAKIIADITGCTYENRAHGGGILASVTGDGTTKPRYVVSDVENMADDADLICFEGGINDYWTKVPLGTYSESDFTGTLDDTTICGALESIFRQAVAKWVGKPICFVIVHKISNTVYVENTQGYTFKDAHDAMLGICKKYSIPVFDAFENSGLNAYNPIQNETFLTANERGTGDGCHPNEAGYKAYYVPQLIALFESLIERD